MSLRPIALFLAVAVAWLLPDVAWAETKVWDGGGGNLLWSTRANWQPDGVPTSADDVVIDVPGSVTVQVNGFQAAASITCTETLQLTGGSLTVGAAGAPPSTIAHLALLGGTLTGSGSVSVNGSFTWTDGTMNGTGTTTVTAAATANLAGGASQRQLGRTLVLGTNATLSGTGIFFFVGGNLQVSSGATLTLDGPGTLAPSGGTSSILIQGVLRKSGAGTYSINAGLTFQNAGLVDVTSGTLASLSAGPQTGAFTVAAGSVLRVGGDQTFQATSSVVGGTLELAGTGIVIGGSVDVEQIIESSGNAVINGAVDAGGITVTSGLLTLNDAVDLQSLAITGGTLTGSGAMSVSGSFAWTNGTLSGGGTTTIAPSSTVNLAAGTNQRILGRVLVLQASGTISGQGVFFLNGGTLQVAAAATLTLDGPGTIVPNGGSSTISVDGVLRKTGSGIYLISSGLTFQNAGLVDVAGGTLSILGSGTHSGDFTIASDAKLSVANGTQTFLASSSIDGGTLELGGPGSVQGPISVNQLIASGTVTVSGPVTTTGLTVTGGNLTLNTPLTVASLAVSGGTLGGSGAINVTEAFTWTGGTLSGTGLTTIADGVVMNLAGPNQRVLGRELRILADGELSGAGSIFFAAGTLRIGASSTFGVSGSVTLNLSGSPSSVIVEGSLVKTGGGSFTLSGAIVLQNNGTVVADSGTIALTNSASVPQVTGTTLTGGAWQVKSAGTLSLPIGMTIRTIGGTASVGLDGPTSSFAALAPLTTIASGGSLTLSGGRDLAIAPVGGTFALDGTLAIGAASDVDVTGAMTFGNAAALTATFSSTSDTPIGATGAATVGGSLLVTHAAGFNPPVPSSMTLLTASTLAGTFASIDTPVGGSSSQPPPIVYTANAVLYSVLTADQVDLVASAIVAPATATIGNDLTFSWTLSNGASGPAQGPWLDRIFLSLDASANTPADDVAIGTLPFTGVLLGNQSLVRTATVTIPALSGGPRYLVVRTDADNTVQETNEANNGLVGATAITLVGPDLVVSAIGAPATLVQAQPTAVGATITNSGTANAPGATAVIRWSADAIVDASDVLLGQLTTTETIPPNQSASPSTTVTIPLNGSVPLGPGFLLVEADASGLLIELNESNNSAALPITVVEPPLADLVGSALAVAPVLSAGGPANATWTTTNAGEIATAALWTERLTLLAAPNATTSLGTIGELAVSSGLAAGASAPRTLPGTIPFELGERWIALDLDVANSVVEGSGDTNNRTLLGPVTIVGANLTPTTASGPTTAEALQTITVSYSAKNAGVGGSYGPCWSDRLYLSVDETLDAGDLQLGVSTRCTNPLVAGATYAGSFAVAIPSTVTAGSYRLLVAIDADGTRFETSNADNLLVAGVIEVTPATTPNLVVSAINGPTTAVVGGTVTINWSVTNIGDEALTSGWSDRVFLSNDPTFGNDAAQTPILASVPLAPGAGFARTQAVPTPATPGQYWVFVRTDDANQVSEFNGENDNVSVAFGPIEVDYGALPDLVPCGSSSGRH